MVGSPSLNLDIVKAKRRQMDLITAMLTIVRHEITQARLQTEQAELTHVEQAERAHLEQSEQEEQARLKQAAEQTE